MATYNFLNLAPDEFENLSRDLLQEFLGLHFESFKPGKDGGVDLRAWIETKYKVVVQCKRYGDWGDLFAVLKDEAKKVLIMNPDRYILITSVGLSPLNKKQIASLFNSKLHECDIFGMGDLNNLIDKNPEIEKRHYKLWLASTNILQAIINNKVLIQSQFEQENLRRIAKIYVMNTSFDQAFTILKQRKFVILSGNPGVGKTTLARVLAYDFVQNGYQLVVAANSIKEAYDAYSDGKDQVILFDDFLGRNILEGRYPMNEESQLVRFIEKISESKNKVLILTTREYILNQAKNKYEIIKSSEIDIAKCIVDVSKYTKFIKAKILYNHLYFAQLPEKYINQIVDSRAYQKIIEHQNYNPRIIEALIRKADWENVSPQKYTDVLLQYFNKPYSIWETAYESEINELSKVLLLLLLSAGTPMLRDDLKLVIHNFIETTSGKYQVSLNDFTFSASIRELHDTFISTIMDANGDVAIDFQNPSIQDFLVDYLANNSGLQEDIIKSATFFGQLFKVFTLPEKANLERDGFFSDIRIGLKEQILISLYDKLVKDFGTLRSSEIVKLHYRKQNIFTWNRNQIDVYKRIDMIITNGYQENDKIENFIIEVFRKYSVPNGIDGWDISYYLSIVRFFKRRVKVNPSDVMKALLRPIYWGNQLYIFKKLENIFPKQYKEFVSMTPEFSEKIMEVVKNEYENADEDNFSDTISSIEDLIKDFGADAQIELEDLLKKSAAYDDNVESSIIDNMEYRNDSESDFRALLN